MARSSRRRISRMSWLARISRKCSAASPTSWVKLVGTRGASIRSAVLMSRRWAAITRSSRRASEESTISSARRARCSSAGTARAHRRQRRTDGGERRLEGVRLVLGRLADLLRHAPEVEHQLVEVARHARQLGHDVAVAEGVVADAALADLGGDLAEAAQAEADADGDQQGEDRPARGRCAAATRICARLPIGPADRGVEEFRGGVGRGQHPAARRRVLIGMIEVRSSTVPLGCL